MNDAKSTVKTALSFVLVVVLIVATLFGIKVPYGIEDVAPEADATVEANGEVAPDTTDETENAPTEEVETPTTEDVEQQPTDEVVTDAPQETTPTENEIVEDVEISGEGEVAEPTETEQPATEGDVENA